MHLSVTLISLLLVLVSSQNQPFHIPLPFGGINVDKNPDGTTNFNIDSGLNILGFGAKKNTTFTSGNGTFLIKDNNNAIVNGSDVGGGGTVGFTKQGVVVDNNVNLGKKGTVEGGLGKESGFFNGLFNAFNNKNGRR